MRHMKNLVSVAAAVAALLLSASVVAAGDEDLDTARDATEPYQDVAAAEAAGYALPADVPLEDCIDEPGQGAMGFHYISGELVGDIVLDPAQPEALVYEPQADGSLELVALEYVVFAAEWDAANAAPPSLFGEEFMLVEEPNRYELPSFYALHAWIWKENPSGTFAAFNPDVTCDPDAAPDTAVPAPTASRVPTWTPFAGVLLLLAGADAARRILR